MKCGLSTRPPSRGRQGFTLLELMVSLTIGGIAITAIYAVGAASTRVFYQQHQLAIAQTAVRLAIHQVKRDIARAGFMSTPGIDLPGQSCAPVQPPLHDPGGSGRLAGISFFDNDKVLAAADLNLDADPAGTNRANGFTVDEIVLMANYETANEYPGASVAFGLPTQLTVSSNWYSFHHDFTNWFTLADPPTVTPGALPAAFAVNRLMRIRMPSGQLHFAQVTRVIPAAGLNDTRIEFNPALPAGCASAAIGSWIAPVSTIRYFVRNAPADELRPDAPETTGRMAQLIREEVLPTDKRTPLFAVNPTSRRGPGTRAVLDYVVGFNLSFTMTDPTPPGAPDAYVPGDARPRTPDNAAVAPTDAEDAQDTLAINNNPERIRSVVIDIAVRTQEQDPAFPFDNCIRQRCFQTFSDRPGASRVRRLRSEVFVPNIAYEGY